MTIRLQGEVLLSTKKARVLASGQGFVLENTTQRVEIFEGQTCLTLTAGWRANFVLQKFFMERKHHSQKTIQLDSNDHTII